MQQWIKEVARGKRGSKDLNYEDTKEVAEAIVSGQATDAQIAAYLVALRIKTETPEELLAFVHVLREHSRMIPVPESVSARLVDFASPYNGRQAFAATIPASILLAEQGIPVFLHSSNALPPKYGVSIKEIVQLLGVNSEAEQDKIGESIQNVNLGFAWTDQFSPPLANLRSIRKEIGVRTLLNTAEKLLNLSQAKHIIMGAFHRTAINKIIPLMHGLAYEKVFIVQGAEGSEDLPAHRNSFLYELSGVKADSTIVKPEEYGLLDKNVTETPLTAEDQRQIILALLKGERAEELSHYYSQTLLNTGLRYYLFGKVASIGEGIELAKGQLQSGAGLVQLEKWKLAQGNVLG